MRTDPITAEAMRLAADRPRRPFCVTVVAEAPDGSQVLVQHWPGEGNWSIATRDESWHSWSPPLQIISAGEHEDES